TSHSCPNGSMTRPRRQPCSSPRGDDSVAPAATAWRTMRSGSSTTSSVRLVAPSITRGLKALHRRRGRRHPKGRVAYTELGDHVVPVAEAMEDVCAERGLVEADRFDWPLDPEFRLDARHRPLVARRVPAFLRPAGLSMWCRARGR